MTRATSANRGGWEVFIVKELKMSGIKLPIEVGQKFLSHGKLGEIVSTTIDDDPYPVAWMSDDRTMIQYFTENGRYYESFGKHEHDLQPIPEPEIVIPEGVDFHVTSEAMRKKCLEMQENGRNFLSRGTETSDLSFDGSRYPYRLLPVTITEGVEFCGPEYREEFERLAKEGREFEFRNREEWAASRPEFYTDIPYRLLPQHPDANGNVLKVGDRVQGRHEMRITIARFENGLAIDENENGEYLVHCRKLTTKTRPLCEADLMQHRTALFRCKNGENHFHATQFCETEVWIGFADITYAYLQEKWEWSPSADQPWGPCEVTEEVLA